MYGLRDHLVEVAEVVRAPEVRHAPVVVVPEVRSAARAQGTHEVIPLLGSEISEVHTKYILLQNIKNISKNI